MTTPFDHPDAAKALEDLSQSLLEESPRGAILVGAARVEECLTELISAVLPSDLSRKKRKELLSYRGALGTFGAKIDVCFGVRLIDDRLYDCLHALRKLRNAAAHSHSAFGLVGREEEYRAAYSRLGDSLETGIQGVAFRAMMTSKLDAVMQAYANWDAGEHGFKPTEAERDESIGRMLEDPDVLAKLERQLPHWELAVGLGVLCGMIILSRESAKEVFDGRETFVAVARAIRGEGGAASASDSGD